MSGIETAAGVVAAVFAGISAIDAAKNLKEKHDTEREGYVQVKISWRHGGADKRERKQKEKEKKEKEKKEKEKERKKEKEKAKARAVKEKRASRKTVAIHGIRVLGPKKAPEPFAWWRV